MEPAVATAAPAVTTVEGDDVEAVALAACELLLTTTDVALYELLAAALVVLAADVVSAAEVVVPAAVVVAAAVVDTAVVAVAPAETSAQKVFTAGRTWSRGMD
jgi:hypothetical protein